MPGGWPGNPAAVTSTPDVLDRPATGVPVASTDGSVAPTRGPVASTDGSVAPTGGPTVSRRRRVASLDVLRGATIGAMLLVNNAGDKAAMPRQLVHSPWDGLTVADTVFPLFLFAVGTSMPFSRRAEATRPALRRVALLAVVGSLLVDAKYRQLGPTTGVLQVIAAGYLLAWLVSRLPARLAVAAGVALLAGLTGLALLGGVEPGTTTAEAVDRAVLGHPSAQGVFAMLGAALNVLGGRYAGLVLRRHHRARAVLPRLLLAAAATGAAGALLAQRLPVNKQVWSPSYVLVTSGIALALLAAGWLLVDRFGTARWFRPFTVLGANALVVYAGSYLVFSALLRFQHDRLVAPLTALGGPRFGALAFPLLTVALFWVVCEVLYRRRIFVKV